MKQPDDQIARWAEYVRTNPDWRKFHNDFINAQFQMHEQFLQRLLKTPGGREKIIELYGIKNLKGYEGLLGPAPAMRS